MEVALYHPEVGYYRNLTSPIGIRGDFYTAAQLQPVFGRLIATYIRMLTRNLEGNENALVELGAGLRPEMAAAFSEFRYMPVDLSYGALPSGISGAVFTNEFFDAVPVDVVVRRNGVLHEMLVGFDGARFHWIEGAAADEEGASALAGLEEGELAELQHHRLSWLDRMIEMLEQGFIVTVDYGFTREELVRFPAGTLMSYHRHQALEDVLAEPGIRDITAHVAFSDLQERGESRGLKTVRFESLASALLRAGEADQFASALAAESEQEKEEHLLQLKTLLFGMGESFRVLVQRKDSK